MRAIDQAGNVGVTAERSFLVDTSGPAVLLGDVAVSGTTARVSFSSEAGARFECSLDGGTFETCTSPREYTGLTSGSHTIRVRAIDQAGNVGVAAERGFVVDTSAPAVTIGDVAVSGTTARVTFSSEAGARFECSLDNGPFVACTSPREYAGLTSGSHTVRVRAIDQAGNVGVAAERGFVIASPPPPEPTPDTTAPKVRPKPRSVYVSNNGRFKVSLRCPNNEIRCRIVIKIRYRGTTLTSKAVTVLGGSSKTVALKLKPSARAALDRERSPAGDGRHHGAGPCGQRGHDDDQAQTPRVTGTIVRRAAERPTVRSAAGAMAARRGAARAAASFTRRCGEREGELEAHHAPRAQAPLVRAPGERTIGSQTKVGGGIGYEPFHEEIDHGPGGRDRRHRMGRCGDGRCTDPGGRRLQ